VYFEQNCGKQFDPVLCPLFLKHYHEFVALRNAFSRQAEVKQAAA